MREHRYVLAPHGHGLDTHRLWEALYMGCIPIVQRSAMDSRLLADLPVLLVDTYEEVTPRLLRGRYDGLSRRWDAAWQTALNLSFWKVQFDFAASA
jgi:hypothetical protein